MAVNNPHKSFTCQHKGTANQLITPCGICQAFNPATTPVRPQLTQYNGLWDTGATGTVITQKIVDELGLKPISMAKMSHAGGVGDTEVYLINIMLPNNVGLHSVKVLKGNLSPNIDVLIGMDIISKGDFAVSNFNGKTTFTFRVPSKEEISFVQNNNPSANANTHYEGQKVGRNEKCPCGSGKKFKQCHGK